jgi:hypothetical protein
MLLRDSDRTSGDSGLFGFLRAKGRAWLGSSPADAFRGRWHMQDGALYDFADDGLKIVERGTLIEYRQARAADFAMSYHWTDVGELRAQFPHISALADVAPAAQCLAVLRVRRGSRDISYVVTQPKKRMMAISADRTMHLFRAG